MADNTYRTTVLEAWPETPSVRVVRVAVPDGFSFQVNESVKLHLKGEASAVSREVSVATGPERPFLEFAMRYSESAFKQAFFSLQPGDEATIEGPVGSFPLNPDRPALMIAGGIGITPFRSMLQTIADSESGQRVVLVYANSTPEEVAFAAELGVLSNRAPNIEVLYTVSRAAGEHVWLHRTGRIDTAFLAEARAKVPDAVCYIAGPEGFVAAGAKMLREIGVPESDIMAEDFPGYGDPEKDPGSVPADLPPMFQRMDWNERYLNTAVEDMPWFRPDLDPDIANVLDAHHITNGTALDLGTGPGTQAIALAKRGFAVTGTDVSQAAVDKAAERAKNEVADVRFVCDDMLASTLHEQFDFVLDRGCFHTMEPMHRKNYIRTLHTLVKPGGTVALKCFSYKETRPGPFRFSPSEIRDLFGGLFDIVSLEESSFRGNRAPSPLALVCVMHPKSGQA